jgi:hypothetical protein
MTAVPGGLPAEPEGSAGRARPADTESPATLVEIARRNRGLTASTISQR